VAEVVLDGVVKRYPDGTLAVNDLDLAVRDGEFLVLVGPSGCGKTTALRMVAGLEDVTAGEVRIGDRVVNDMPSRDRDVAMVFQSYALYPHLSVAQNIGFGLKLRKTPKAEIRTRVREAARILGLEELLDRKPRNLSGGQRQRVAMGRAIVREPQVFLMDEPLSNLDAKLRVQMRAEIARIQRSLRVTTIYVTHDQVEAMTLGERVAVMNKGVLQQVDKPQVLYDRPKNLFVAGFIGSPAMNIIEGRFERERDQLFVHLGPHRLAMPPEFRTERPALDRYLDQPVLVGIRPEDMEDATLLDAEPDRVLPASADLIEAMGSELVVHLAVDMPIASSGEDFGVDDEVARTAPPPVAGVEGGRIVARFNPRSRAQEGEAVKVAVDTARLHVFDPRSGAAIWSDEERIEEQVEQQDT
jgi:multiple sugar transport system ATP-binding protein